MTLGAFCKHSSIAVEEKREVGTREEVADG
jgi:hypothetical protein